MLDKSTGWRWRRFGCGCLLAAVLLASAQAETLEQAWGVALEQDSSLLAARSRLAAAQATLAVARSARVPAVYASSRLLQLDEVPAFDFSAVGVTAQLPLFSGASLLIADTRVAVPLHAGGSIRRGVDAARSSLAGRQAGNAALVQDIRLSVAEAYIGVLRAQSGLRVADSTVGTLAAHAADVDDLYRAGEVPRNDSLSAQVSLADASQRRLQAHNRLEIARSIYNQRLGRPLTAPVSLEKVTALPSSVTVAGAPEVLVQRALSARHELRGIDAAALALQAQADVVRATTRPRLSASGGYTYLENQVLDRENFWSIGLDLRWSPFDGGRAAGRAQALDREAAALRHERANLESLIALQVRQTWLDVQEAAQRIEVTARAVEQAAENMRVVRDRYRNGEGTNTEVLDARTLQSVSASNHDNARYDSILARLRLAHAAGEL